MLPEDLVAGMRHRLAHSGLPSLVAATLNWNDHQRHVRFDFFFGGSSEDADLDQLEFDVLAQLIADMGMGVETAGFAAVFDRPSAENALSDPARLYPP